MNWNCYINLKKTKVTLYNLFKLVGKPSSELETILLGGISELKNIDGFYTECLFPITESLTKNIGKLRMDFGICCDNPFKINVYIEGNGAQHFWKWGEKQTDEDYTNQQINFYYKQKKSSVPIININMLITGNTITDNMLRYEAYNQLIVSKTLEKAIKQAINSNKHINISIRKDGDIIPDITKCGYKQIDDYISYIIEHPDFEIVI